MTHLARFTPDLREHPGKWCEYNGPRFLVRLGEQWPHDPRYRLIHETTPDAEKAKQFATEEDARACLAEARAGKGWEVVEVKG